MSKDHYGMGGIYQRGKVWWIHYSLNGRTFRESSKSHNKQAAKDLLKQKLGLTAATPDQITVAALLDDSLRQYRIDKVKHYWWAELIIEKHLRPAFGYYKAHRIGTQEITKYIEEKRATGLADSTINRHLAVLRHSFKIAFKSDPPRVARVPHIPKLSEDDRARTGFFDADVFAKVRAELPPELRPVATFAYYTACRKSEILGLKWSQVDLSSSMIRLHRGKTKNDQPRMIPMTEEVLAALTELKAERDENWPEAPYVFTRQGQRIKDMYGAWRAACERAGFPGMLLHDFRRTGIRNMVRAQVPERVAMAISGHKTRSVFDRYNIVSEGDLREAARKLDRKKGNGEE